jgi:hypothetical protein
MSFWIEKEQRDMSEFQTVSRKVRKRRGAQIPPILRSTSQSMLRASYDLVCDRNNERYPLLHSRTSTEISLFKEFPSALETFRTIWIGNWTVDLFCPRVVGERGRGGRRMTGAAIEINGRVHDGQRKMSLDEAKGELLLRLGIVTLVVENPDIRKLTVMNLIRDLEKCQTRDRSIVRRLWRKVYVETLAHCADDSLWEELSIDCSEQVQSIELLGSR